MRSLLEQHVFYLDDSAREGNQNENANAMRKTLCSPGKVRREAEIKKPKKAPIIPKLRKPKGELGWEPTITAR